MTEFDRLYATKLALSNSVANVDALVIRLDDLLAKHYREDGFNRTETTDEHFKEWSDKFLEEYLLDYNVCFVDEDLNETSVNTGVVKISRKR